MTEREINRALEKRRRNKRWTADEMAFNLDQFSSGERYQRRIWEDSAEAVHVAHACRFLGEPFPDATVVARGEVCGKIKEMIVDSGLTVRQIVIGRALRNLRPECHKKYMDRAYQFLHNNSSNAFWICVFYAGLKKPCLSYWDVLNLEEKSELVRDMSPGAVQQEFPELRRMA